MTPQEIVALIAGMMYARGCYSDIPGSQMDLCISDAHELAQRVLARDLSDLKRRPSWRERAQTYLKKNPTPSEAKSLLQEALTSYESAF